MKILHQWLFQDFVCHITPEDISLNAHRLDPVTLDFLKTLAAQDTPPVESLPPEEARKVLSSLQASVPADISGIEISEKDIEVEGQPISLTIVKPQGIKEALPVVMFFHGGGWVLGDFETHQRLVRDIAVETRAAIVFVNYTPSPEARYPTAIDQAYQATAWVAQHGDEINVDGKRLAVAGNSVGGNMATIVCLKAKEKGGPDIQYQVLFWPVTHADFETDSYRKFASGYFLTRDMMRWFWDNYSNDVGQREDIKASPLNASVVRLKGLPPALVQTAEFDVLRDEGEAYARKLAEAGVATTATRYLGTIHDFGLLNPLAATQATLSAIRQAAAELRRALYGSRDPG